MKTLLLSLLLACLPLPAFAQTAPATDTPEAAAAALYAAMQRGDWKGAAALFDPAALKEFRGTMAPLLELGADGAQAEALAMMFGGLEPAELKAASDTAFFAAFFGGIVASTGVKLDQQQVLGSVAEGDVRHVVTRNTVSGMGIRLTQMEVVSARKTADGWRVLLSGEMKGMAEVLSQRLKMEAAPEAGASEAEMEAGPEADADESGDEDRTP